MDSVARRVARVLALRVPVAVSVGAPPPGEVADAVGPGDVALVAVDGGVRVALGAPTGLSYAHELSLPSLRGMAAARAIALVVESLRDSAIEGPPSRQSPRADASGGAPREWQQRRVLRVLEGGRPWRTIDRLPLAKPTIYLRALLGVSPLRGTVLVGPGAGFGLCIAAHCAVLEGDLPLIAEERTAPDGARIRYRFLNFSMRLQFRPIDAPSWAFGFSGGLITRLGTATVGEDAETRVVTDLGARSTAEFAWKLSQRFEAVLELGLDFVFDRARFLRDGASVFLEDRWTPWSVVSFRLRPGA